MMQKRCFTRRPADAPICLHEKSRMPSGKRSRNDQKLAQGRELCQKNFVNCGVELLETALFVHAEGDHKGI
jgi:hypothetical protein